MDLRIFVYNVEFRASDEEAKAKIEKLTWGKWKKIK
jgi:hypothetical protein